MTPRFSAARPGALCCCTIVHVKPNPTRRWVFGRKVEAIELISGRRGGVFFGADDEKRGGWVYHDDGGK